MIWSVIRDKQVRLENRQHVNKFARATKQLDIIPVTIRTSKGIVWIYY
jgi:hypothetical protein